MRTRVAAASALAAAMALVLGACGSPTATPPVIINTPPVIESLVIAGDRAEADQPISITATIKDAETPISQLTYTWSASPQTGTFSGNSTFSGSQVSIMWRPPKGQKTPDVYLITLTVSEAYTSAGQAKQNVVSKSTTVHYNDSPGEMASLGFDFLVSKFGNFNVSPAEAVSNFSDSTRRQPDGSVCSDEKAKEFDDITGNRANFHILSATYRVDSITFNDDRTFATMMGLCVFEDILLATGQKERVPGICTLTGVYENFRWLLCRSNDAAAPGMTTTPLELRRYQVPGYRPD